MSLLIVFPLKRINVLLDHFSFYMTKQGSQWVES